MCFTRFHGSERARSAGCLDLATLGRSGAFRCPFWSRTGTTLGRSGASRVPSGAALGPLRGDEISRQKVFRDSCAPDVQSPLLSGPVWGRQPHRRSGPLSTCAQERGRERMRLEDDRENSAKNPQRLPRVNSPKSPPPGPNPPAAGPPAGFRKIPELPNFGLAKHEVSYLGCPKTLGLADTFDQKT